MKKIYEVIIIGGGPAGITATIYCVRKKLKTLLITKDLGGQASWSGDIENYPGINSISGPDLTEKFETQLKYLKAEYILGKEITSIKRNSKSYSITLGGKQLESKVLIIATGKKPRHLGIDGEAAFNNRGVSYCATCDGPFFSNKNVAVVGGGNSALDAAVQLLPIANRIYIVNNTPKVNGDQVMLRKVTGSKKVHVLNNHTCVKIIGDKFVSGLIIQNSKKKRQTLPVSGIFIEIGSVPANSLITSLNVKLNKYGEILVDEYCRTNINGLFAAGDVTSIPEKQLVVAAGHGSIAALSAYKYLTTDEHCHNRFCYHHK